MKITIKRSHHILTILFFPAILAWKLFVLILFSPLLWKFILSIILFPFILIYFLIHNACIFLMSLSDRRSEGRDFHDSAL